METHVETVRIADMTDEDCLQTAALRKLAYHDKAPVEEIAAGFRERREAPDPLQRAARMYIVRQGGIIVAAARLFSREVVLPTGKATIGALASVKSHPDVRGQGLGKAVVLAAFEEVDRGDYPLALFQTGDARGFYEKLGCKLVTNNIVNSLDQEDPQARPFWDVWVMRYKGDELWANGDIDLLGPGY